MITDRHTDIFSLNYFNLEIYPGVQTQPTNLENCHFLSMGIILVLIVNDFLIARHAASRLYYDVDKTPRIPVAIVLGTSKYAQGTVNLYYRTRIKATVDLFQAGKIQGILVSGDNATREYDEPTTMKKDLIKSVFLLNL